MLKFYGHNIFILCCLDTIEISVEKIGIDSFIFPEQSCKLTLTWAILYFEAKTVIVLAKMTYQCVKMSPVIINKLRSWQLQFYKIVVRTTHFIVDMSVNTTADPNACENLDDVACHRLKSSSNLICSKDGLSSNICPRMCGKCCK